jgi:hypothetical protein
MSCNRKISSILRQMFVVKKNLEVWNQLPSQHRDGCNRHCTCTEKEFKVSQNNFLQEIKSKNTNNVEKISQIILIHTFIAMPSGLIIGFFCTT